MPHVSVSREIDAPVEQVWSIIRDFNAMPAWTDFVADSKIEEGLKGDQVGCVRNFHLKNGANVREQLTAFSDDSFTFSYRILESPMPIENYISELTLTPVTDTNSCLCQWTADFDCAEESSDKMSKVIANHVFESALQTLSERLSEAGEV